MARGLYTARLQMGTTTSSSALASVVPSDQVWVVRCVTYFTIDDSGLVYTGVGPSTSSVEGIVCSHTMATSDDSFTWMGEQLLEPGETLLSSAATTNLTFVMVTGWQLVA